MDCKADEQKGTERRGVMEFYQTNAGKNFFEGQLPLLIRALEGMTEALNRRQMPVALSAKVGDDFLRELYYGNIGIGVSSMEGFDNEKLKEITILQEELRKELNEEQWKLFEQCSCKMTGYTSSESCRMFQHGFRLAVNLIAAGLGMPGKN